MLKLRQVIVELEKTLGVQNLNANAVDATIIVAAMSQCTEVFQR